jgi:exopolyphosphatase/guanosine-5'-triphosphate,3'-diphosphate pyrophosphatase
LTRSGTVAALDFGTNTLKLTVAQCSNEGIKEVYSAAAVVRIGRAIGLDGQIADEAIERAMTALIEFERVSRQYGATTFTAVATEALRVARNGPDLVDRIAQDTAWKLDVISGDQEARLTFEGLRHELPERGTGLIVDIGGGSTELVLAKDRSWISAESHQVGSGMLTDRCFTSDPPDEQQIEQARDQAIGILDRSGIDRTTRIDQMLLAGGSGLFMDALSRHFRHEMLTLATLPGLIDELTNRPAVKIAAILSIPIERARVLPAGHQVAMTAIEMFEPEALLAVPSGIRAGIIARWCASELD